MGWQGKCLASYAWIFSLSAYFCIIYDAMYKENKIFSQIYVSLNFYICKEHISGTYAHVPVGFDPHSFVIFKYSNPACYRRATRVAPMVVAGGGWVLWPKTLFTTDVAELCSVPLISIMFLYLLCGLALANKLNIPYGSWLGGVHRKYGTQSKADGFLLH